MTMRQPEHPTQTRSSASAQRAGDTNSSQAIQMCILIGHIPTEVHSNYFLIVWELPSINSAKKGMDSGNKTI